MTFGRFTWGKDTHPEADKIVNPNEVLHERAYIVMKLGELTARDQAYLVEHLEDMLKDEELQEAWSRVHIGQPVFKYRVELKAVAAEWNRLHPHIDPPYTLQEGKFVVEPTANGVNIYLSKEWKNKGKPDEEVKVDAPWIVAPAGSKPKDVELLISNQKREDQILDENRRVRQILGGKS